MNNLNKGSIIPITLIASAIIGFLALTGMMLIPDLTSHDTSIFINPSKLQINPGQKFTINVTVKSNTPVNAFTGILEFDETKLKVDRIDYNTSIANLWAQEPWFNKGTGKIVFTGGTTKMGGFTGEGNLVTVTFLALGNGSTYLKLTNARILKHDGLGTDAELSTPIDAVFTISTSTSIITEDKSTISSGNIPVQKSTDLNDDGYTNLLDVSIFMIHLATQNLRSDFNNDGHVNTTDLSILLNNRQ